MANRTWWQDIGDVGDVSVGHLGGLMDAVGLDSPYWSAARQNRNTALDRWEKRGSGGRRGMDIAGGAFGVAGLAALAAGGLKGVKLLKSLRAAKSAKAAKKVVGEAKKTSWGRRLLKTAPWLGSAAGLSYMGHGLSKSGQRASNAERERDEAIAGLQGLIQQNTERQDAAPGPPRGGPGGADLDPGSDMGMGEFRPRSDVADWARQEAESLSQPPPGRGSQGLGYRMGPGGWKEQSIRGHFLSADMGASSPYHRRLKRGMEQDEALGAQRRDFYAGLAQAAESGAAPQQLQGLVNRVQTGMQMAPLQQQVREHQTALGMKDRELRAARRNEAFRAATGLAGQLPEYQRSPEQLQSFFNQFMSQVS